MIVFTARRSRLSFDARHDNSKPTLQSWPKATTVTARKSKSPRRKSRRQFLRSGRISEALSASGKILKRPLKFAGSVDQPRTGLKKIGRPQFNDASSACGWRASESSPQRGEVHLFAAPTRKDEIRCRGEHVLVTHGALTSRTTTTTGEDVVSTDEFDQFADPRDPADGRVGPFFKIYPRPANGRAPHLAKLSFEICGQFFTRIAPADSASDESHGCRDLGERALIGREDCRSCADEGRGDVRLDVGKCDQQVGAIRENAFRVPGTEAAHDRTAIEPGLVRVCSHSDHILPRPDACADVGGFSAEAGDAHRRCRQNEDSRRMQRAYGCDP